jgi:phage tail protein X
MMIAFEHRRKDSPMKQHWRSVGIAAVLTAVSLVPATAPRSASRDFFVHEVRKGETLSLICLMYYGHYSGVMGDAVLELNPSMKSANIVTVGQRIKLPNPEEPTEEHKGSRPLFERRIDVTQGVVTYVRGNARLTPHNATSQSRLAANTIVYPGDVLETGGDGRVEVIINSESVVRMRENTRLHLETFQKKQQKQSPTRLRFTMGTLWTKVKRFSDKISRFELELPTAVAGVRGTVYQTTVSSEGESEVKVYDGKVAVKNRASADEGTGSTVGGEVTGPHEVAGPREVSFQEWVHIVGAMQKIHIDKHGKPDTPASFTDDPSDAWARWNRERDQRVARVFAEPL